MTEGLIEKHNDVVRDGDTVFHLGDFSLSERFVEPVLARLRGKHILIPGNHDACHRKHKNFEGKRLKYIQYGFAEIYDQVKLRDVPTGALMLLDHMPYTTDERHAERYAQYRPRDDGSWLLHGHTHGIWKQKGRMIDVGVDARGYAPMHADEISTIIRKG
jgi:calcineurin-like phosphoesterase family protein